MNAAVPRVPKVAVVVVIVPGVVSFAVMSSWNWPVPPSVALMPNAEELPPWGCT